MQTKTVLNVGCGKVDLKSQSEYFGTDLWKEVRVDSWEGNETADVYANITDLKGIDDESVDAVWACHVVEHVHFHELPAVFGSIMRVLKKDGFAVIRVPDLGAIVDHIKDGLIDKPIYDSSAGPIFAIDMLYGHRGLVQSWGEGMCHRTGFTSKSMAQILESLKISAFINTLNHEVVALLYKDAPPIAYMDSGKL